MSKRFGQQQHGARRGFRCLLAASALAAAAGSGSAGVVVATNLTDGAPSVWRVLRQTIDADGVLAWDRMPSVALLPPSGEPPQCISARAALATDGVLGVVTDCALSDAALLREACATGTEDSVRVLIARDAPVILGFVADPSLRSRLVHLADSAGYVVVRTRGELLTFALDAPRVFGVFDPEAHAKPTGAELTDIALRVMERHDRGYLEVNLTIGSPESPDLDDIAAFDRVVDRVRRWTAMRPDALHISYTATGPRGLSARALASPSSQVAHDERVVMAPAARELAGYAIRFIDMAEDGMIRAEGAFADDVHGVLDADQLCRIVAEVIGDPSPRSSDGVLTLLSQIALPGAEIVDWDAEGQRLVATYADGLAIVDLQRPRSPSLERTIALDAWRALGHDIRDVTHVAVDPAGRGVAAASCPGRNGDPGMVSFIDLSNGDVLSLVEVGHLPDAVAFTTGGDALIVANEGEPIIESGRLIDDPPGSASIIGIDNLPSASAFRSLSPTAIDVPFDEAMLHACDNGLRAGLRIHPAVSRRALARDIEPESIAITPHGAFVTLQENNGVAVLDVASGVWRCVQSLGMADRVIDGCDDGRIDVSDRVRAMRMPDQIAAFEVDQRWYIITADEGESRAAVGDGPRGDTARLEALLPAADRAIRSSVLAPGGLPGRLHACAFSGDTDADGRLDEVIIPGARSASIFDARTLELVGDTESQFESMLASQHPQIFNASWNAPDAPDARSDQRGPEPEGVTVGRVGDRTLAFIGLERPGAIAIIDVSDPTAPRTVEIVNTCADGLLAPEGLKFIEAQKSPTGAPLLAVGFEGSGHVAIYAISQPE